MESHPYAEIFPLLEPADLAELAADIKQNGQRAPIIFYEGKILDGRNRAAACELAGIEPWTLEFGSGDPLAYVLSVNLHRRHLTESQRAMVAAKIAQLPHGGDRKRAATDQDANLRLDPAAVTSATTIAAAAQKLAVSPRLVQEAKTVLQSPQQTAAVESGQKSVHKAATEIRQARSANTSGERAEAGLRDATGYLIPEELVPLWNRASEAKEWLRMISGVYVAIKKAVEQDEVLYQPVNLRHVLGRLNGVSSELSLAVPYAVCVECQGHGVDQTCALCQGRGFLNELAFETCVPEELKKARAEGVIASGA